MKKFLTIVMLMFCGTAHAATMQVGYMSSEVTGPPFPFNYDILATSPTNTISDSRMYGTWNVSITGSTDGINIFNTVSVQQTDNTKNDWILINLWALDLINPGTLVSPMSGYQSTMTFLSPLADNIAVLQLTNYSNPVGAPYYSQGLGLYSDNGPTTVYSAGTYIFDAIYPVIGNCTDGCSVNSQWFLYSTPVVPAPVAGSGLLFFLAGGLALLARRRRA